jgi:hypothetical protein
MSFFDKLTGRAQPTEESIKRLERFVLRYSQSLRSQSFDVKSYSLAQKMQKKSDRVLDLLRGWRLN